jgi:hypothetical protein
MPIIWSTKLVRGFQSENYFARRRSRRTKRTAIRPTSRSPHKRVSKTEVCKVASCEHLGPKPFCATCSGIRKLCLPWRHRAGTTHNLTIILQLINNSLRISSVCTSPLMTVDQQEMRLQLVRIRKTSSTKNHFEATGLA